MKKSCLLLILFWGLSLSLAAAEVDRGNEYQAWFDSYWKRFNDCSFQLSTQDKADLQALLDIKPKIDTGRFYNVWFVKAFCAFVEDTSPSLDNRELEKFPYVMAAMPDLQGSNQYYHFYLDYVVKEIDDFMPMLDASEKKYFEYFKKAQPYALDSDYETWLAQYNQYKSSYGPILDDNENFVLRFFLDIKPGNSGQDNVTYQVKKETLLRIKYLIQNQQPNSAMAEIDKILNGQGSLQ